MASSASSLFCFFFILVLALSFFHQAQARDSTLFSKFSRKPNPTDNTKETTTPSVEFPAVEAPESQPVVEEHGYGLYGRENYHYSPTTMDPVKTGRGVGQDKFVSLDEIRNEMRKNGKNGYEHEKTGSGVGQDEFVSLDEIRNEMRKNGKNGYESERQGMSDTRFLENGKYYYDINQDVKDENGYKGVMNEQVEEESKYPRESEKQGMSDTRFMENGKYYYDINQENNVRGNNNGYEAEKQGMNEEENGYVSEKQEMSDLENRRYHYDLDEEEEVKNEETYPKKSKRDNGYVTEKQGMSDTRFLENGKYFYDINAEVAKGENNHYNEKNNNYENESLLNNKNEYENVYNENEKYEDEGNNGYEASERRGQNYEPNEYLAHETEGYHGRTKKLPPNQYDTMEEYEKEEEYRLSHKYNP